MHLQRIAWSIAGVCALLAVVDTALVEVAYQLVSTRSVGIHGWPLVNIAALGSAVIGAVILTSHPRHPIGWLLNLIGLSTSFSLAAESYGVWVLDFGGPGTTAQGHLGSWIAGLLGGPLALACLTLVFLLVPDGRFLSPGWRWVARTSFAGYAGYALGLFLAGPKNADRGGEPMGAGPAVLALLSGGVLVITLMILASVVSMVLRYRRSSGAERQQVRVVAIGAASVGLALVVLIVGQSLRDGRQSLATSVPLYVSYALLVGCIAVAVLRYRLYDVELIISRALALAFATGLVALGYVGLVVALGRTVGDRTGAGFWSSLLATVVVALAFQPVRRRVLRIADRLAYGERAAPYDALEDFSRRIGHSPAPGQLLPTIAAAAGEAVLAEHVVVRLDADTGAELTATWSPGTAPPGPIRDARDGDVVIPVEDAAGGLGTITLTLPPGRHVRLPERRLLSDIAEQAALALRNVRLQIELAARVRQLEEHTRQLAASRNRIIDAADTERRRLESQIGRRVLPTMHRLREDVGEYAAGATRADRVGDFVDEATEALESLRELTRGIYPTMLTRSGLGPSLTSFAARIQRAGSLRIDPGVTRERFPARVEAAAYFCCVEVIEGLHGEVDLELEGGDLVMSLFGVTVDALGLLTISDRVAACEGSLDGTGDDGSTVRVRLPVAAPVPA